MVEAKKVSGEADPQLSCQFSSDFSDKKGCAPVSRGTVEILGKPAVRIVHFGGDRSAKNLVRAILHVLRDPTVGWQREK